MAIAHRASLSRTGNATTPFVLDRPNTTNGDIIVAAIAAASSTVTITPPAGFTPINNIAFGTGSLWTWWHLTNADPITWNFTTDLGVAARYCSMACQFSGVDTTSPVDTATEQANAADTAVTAAGLDPSYMEDMLLYVGASLSTGTWSPPTSPALFTEARDQPAAAAITLTGAYLLLSSGAATGNVIGTCTVSAVNSGQLVALKDASSTPDVPAATGSYSLKRRIKIGV